MNVKTAAVKNKVKFVFMIADKMSCMAEFSPDQSQKALGIQTYILNMYCIGFTHAHTYAHAHIINYRYRCCIKSINTHFMLFTGSDYVHVVHCWTRIGWTMLSIHTNTF